MTSLPIQVQQFLTQNSLATLATISDDTDYPYVLPVFYVTDSNFNVYFASHKDSKKNHNILSHPHIGISITNSSDLISLQLQGSAKVAEQKPEIIQRILTVANEKSKNLVAPILQIETGLMQVVTCSIHWYRLSNYSGRNAIVVEGTIE